MGQRISKPTEITSGSPDIGQNTPAAKTNTPNDSAATKSKPETPKDNSVTQTTPATANDKPVAEAATRVRSGLAYAGTPEERKQFLLKEWKPFLLMLQAELEEVGLRHAKGFDVLQTMIPQARLLEISKQCRELTTRWHGRASSSAMFEFFIAACQRSNLVAYDFDVVLPTRSEDGFMRVVDGGLRGAFFAIADASKHEGGVLSTGRVANDTGDSPIDNVVLSNILSRDEALIFRVSPHLYRFFIILLRARQRAWLRKLELNLSVELQEEAEFKRKLVELQETGAAQERGVSVSDLSWRVLVAKGRLVEDWGQLDWDDQQRVHKYVSSRLLQHRTDSQPSSEAVDPLDDFIVWTHAHPGRVYRQDKQLHGQLLLTGIMTNKITVVKRSEMEKRTEARYFPHEWVRKVPLWQFTDNVEAVRRAAGSAESSRFTSNKFPYEYGHGMGLSSAGLQEGADDKDTLGYEIGGAMGADEAAKLQNWKLNDIEKIVEEVVTLNPRSRCLPGETLHEAGQNPQHASSIRLTQHTHLARGSMEHWPVYQLENSLQPTPALGDSCALDVIQVGNCEDSFMMRLFSTDPTSAPVLNFLVRLRQSFVVHFGNDKIDFIFTASPEHPEGSAAETRFSVNMVVVGQLEKVKGKLVNQDLGGLTLEAGSPELGGGTPVPTGLSASSVKGSEVVSDPKNIAKALAGRKIVTQLYDLCRKPGARALLTSLLAEVGYKDTLNGMTTKRPRAREAWKDSSRNLFFTHDSTDSDLDKALLLLV